MRSVTAMVHTMGIVIVLSQVCFMIIDMSVFLFFSFHEGLEGFNDKNDRESYACP